MFRISSIAVIVVAIVVMGTAVAYHSPGHSASVRGASGCVGAQGKATETCSCRGPLGPISADQKGESREVICVRANPSRPEVAQT